MELHAIPGEDAVFTECGGGETCAVAGMHAAERGLEAGFVHVAGGEVAADDGVVDVGEQVIDAGVGLVEIGEDGDAGLACPGGGEGGGGGVAAVDVECAGVDDPLAAQIGWLQDEAFVAAAEDGALAAGIDQDEGLRAECIFNGDELGFDAGVCECLAMETGGIVVAKLADVAGAQSPGLAGDDGGGDLAAGLDGGVGVFGLGTAGGVGFERDERVRGVEADAYQVNFFGHGH